MGRIIQLLFAIGLAATTSATAQTVSQLPPVTPFKIEPGMTFSASTAIKPTRERGSTLSPESNRVLTDFKAALEMIRLNHVEGSALETGPLTKSSINTMLGELDPHSSYFDNAEFNELIGEQNSEYSGTGSTISNFVKDGRIETYIIAVHPGSAAARANLRYGDRIVSVDGRTVTGSTVDVVRDQVRGRRGTSVRLVVEKAATGLLETVDIKRERIPQPSVKNAFILGNGTGYIDLTQGFSHTTSTEFSIVLQDLSRRGMRSLVLDLRDNTGGILDQAVKVAEKFLPAGSIVISQRGRDPLENLTWKSTNRSPVNVPLVVVVDARTASAAEIVAGALQDNDRGLILGQTTYGKGLVQKVLELPSGSGLTLTTARYFTPSGRSIQRAYDGAGLYDYFKHRQPTGTPAKLQRRTVTDRAVFGGAGITPDAATETESFNPRRAELIDPIFFFIRDLMRPRSERTEDSRAEAGLLKDEFVARFRSYAAGSTWRIRPEMLDAEAQFIAEQLRYHFALATSGPEAADRVRIKADKEVAQAVAAMLKAAALAESASRINQPANMKKPAGSRSQAGQGRNRRN